MKAIIEVTNGQGAIEVWTLDAIRNANCDRRMRILSNAGLAKIVRKEVTVHTTDKTKQQLCCHYASFKLRQMGHNEAIAIFNADGSQKARLLN